MGITYGVYLFIFGVLHNLFTLTGFDPQIAPKAKGPCTPSDLPTRPGLGSVGRQQKLGVLAKTYDLPNKSTFGIVAAIRYVVISFDYN